MTAEKAISIMRQIQQLLASHHEEDVEVVLAIQAGINALKAQEPAVDAVPVVHARWITYPECLGYDGAYHDEHIVCSACH